MKHLASVFYLLYCLWFACPASAQVARLYSSQHGLKTNSCHSVDIDSRGLVWVAGQNTLGIFDGVRFLYIPISSPDDKHQLFQSAYSVEEYKDNQYWVCTTHGLFLLDASSTTFRHVFLDAEEDSIYGFATNAILDYPLPNHKLVTTDGFGIHVLNTKTMKVDRTLSNKLVALINDAYVKSPLIDKRHRLWVNTAQGKLTCIDLNTLKHHAYQCTPTAANMIQSGVISEMLEVGNDIYIGTNQGLLVYRGEQNLVSEVETSINLNITSLIYTHDKRILVGTDGRGIWERADDGHFLPLADANANFEIAYGKVMDMKEDHAGNVICVFLQKGLVVIPPRSDCFHYHPISPLGNGRNATSITSMTIDQAENYWVATDGCGVFVTEGMKLSTAKPINDGLRSLLVQDVKIDRHGTVWAGSFGGGVQYLENGRWTDGGWLTSLNKELVMTLHYNKQHDRLLVGTNGNGVFCIDIAKHKVEKVAPPAYYNPWISALLLDNEGTMWIGTSGGLFHYNERTSKLGYVMRNNARISNAAAIVQDGNDILIADDEGLIIYNKKTQEQQLISDTDGLSNKHIRAITTTPTHIWVATRTAIASIDKKDHTVRNYSSFGGYDIGEFHRNSSLKPGHGYILFGGDNGIICFTPKLIMNRSTEVKHLYFTSISTPLNTEHLDASIFYAKKVSLDSDNSSFVIGFSAAEMGDPERIHYEYLLEGYENRWHTDAPTPSASYSSLPPGNYTFRVRAYQEDTPNQYTENSIAIHVAAPWYASTLAITLYILLILAAIYALFRQKQNRKRQKEELRRSAEQDRMKEAKLNLFTSITHELRSPLTMIESPLKQLMAEDPNEEHQSLYNVMHRNCDRLLNIVKQITDIRKIDSGQLTLKLEECDYVSYADQVFEQFKGVAIVKGISFVVEHADEELPILMDTTHFEKIITNLLSNAFKFTPQGGKVIARSGMVAGNAELRFYNSGSHFSKEDLAHLRERFYQGSSSADATGSGIGLNLVYELVRLHRGTIEVKNVEPDGVEFTLHFPCYNEAPSELSTHTTSTKPTILLVDDDHELVDYMRSQLTKDYQVDYTFSGNNGWKKVLAERPDVVVTDYRMPNGNGIELCQLIKSNPETENTPVIMLTGEGDEALQLHSLNIQVDHYLEKPVNMMLLRSAISHVLRVRENLRKKVRRTEMGSELPQPEMENTEEKFWIRVNEVIKKHLDDCDFTVTQLSEEVAISRVHLNRKMKEHYGVSPNIFIRSFRLKQAAKLLLSQDVNVSEVAYTVGFASHSYFSTAFHEYFGMSPKEFITYYSEEGRSDALQKVLE